MLQRNVEMKDRTELKQSNKATCRKTTCRNEGK